MLAETFLDQFAPLASGPGGVQKLRELVLNLAIAGRLSTQKPIDGDAAELVDRAASSISAAIKGGDIRKPKYFKRDASKLLRHAIPPNWVWSNLGNLGVISPRNECSENASTGFVPMSAIDAQFGLRHRFEPRSWREIVKGYTHVANGDVVLAKITPCFENGKSAVIDCLPNGLGAGTTELHVFRQLVHVVEPRYVLAFLKSAHFIQNGIPKMTGTAGQKRVPAEYFALTPFPLPPLAEQKRIVAKVDELMALCDELEVQQERETELKRATARSLLNHLVEAKSVEETEQWWSELVPQFSEIFETSASIELLRLTTITLAADGSLSHPSTQAKATKVGDICEKMDSGWSPKCEDFPAKSDGWGVLRTTAVQPMRFLPSANKSLPEKHAPRAEIAVKEGDILLTRAGPTNRVGVCCSATRSFARLMLSDKIIRFTVPKSIAYPPYVALALTGGTAARQLDEAKSGMAASQVNISQKKLRDIEFLLPSLAEQKRLVAKTEEILTLCDQLEDRVHEDQRLNVDLMASFVQKLVGAERDSEPQTGIAIQSNDFDETNTSFASADEEAAPELGSFSSDTLNFTPSPVATAKPAEVDTKFKEAVLVGAVVRAFFDSKDGGEPLGNFRLQKAVYFARRHNGEHALDREFAKQAAGPYNPSMKYSGGIAIAKSKNWIREARGRYGFGHIPTRDATDLDEWIKEYSYQETAQWVAQKFKYLKNDEWELLATVDYTAEFFTSNDIEPDAKKVLQFIASDREWKLKIEKLGLNEVKVQTAMDKVISLFESAGT